MPMAVSRRMFYTVNLVAGLTLIASCAYVFVSFTKEQAIVINDRSTGTRSRSGGMRSQPVMINHVVRHDNRKIYNANDSSLLADKTNVAPKEMNHPTATTTTRSKHSNVKVIIFWTKYFHHTWMPKAHLSNCGKRKCYSTSNHSLLPHADAVVFHGYEYNLLQEIKEALSVPRLTHQYWIYYNRESSQRAPYYNISQYEPVFNWTMTYKLDSDIVFTYARILQGKYLDGFNSRKNYLKGRTHTAFAIISNCFKPRLDYINEMQKYIDIDLYGKCPGHKPFCRNCWKIAKEKYKFYLAFENSLCTDYITEKTYTNAFTHELVPVIISGANLSNPLVMPQGSYVNARSHSSAKRLATYLMEVSNNSTLYNNFFKWRAKWKIVNQWHYKSWECSICEKLYKSNDVKIYEDIYSWFNKSKDCVDWL